MRCPHCGHPEIIVRQDAPIGGEIYDEELRQSVPRLRCAACGKAIVMAEVSPYRPPKRPRGTMRA